ncbi:MAG TPA: hypothetical protein VMO26_30575 [Vicinamibacterales bacterium]|nr:hypothetical protein [Vicinamibacterales bacterium]
MKSVASLMVVVVLLTLAGTVLWFASRAEARMAAAEYALVTLRYERAAEELDTARGSGLFDPLVQRVGGAPTDSATARYWSGDYEALAESEDASRRLLAANAEYRLLRSTGGTFQSFVARLDSIAKQYAEVLRTEPDNEDAAYNYEFVLRLRRAAMTAKQTIPGLDPAAGGVTVHGVPGAPPPDSDAKKFKMIVPMMPDERQEAEEAGRAGRKMRKG